MAAPIGKGCQNNAERQQMKRLFTLREHKGGPLVQPVQYFDNKMAAKAARTGTQVVSYGPDHSKTQRNQGV